MSYIRVYNGDELIQQFELGEDRFSIGRTEGNDLVLGETGVSRQHAAIEFEDGNYYIVDLDSSNGVFVNKQPVKRHKLDLWDEIQIHNFVLKFMRSSSLGVDDDAQEAIAAATDASDKTVFVDLADESRLDDLRNKTRQYFLSYYDDAGAEKTLKINKPRIVIGRSKLADIRVPGWFAPAEAAYIERQGSTFELIPKKRGQVVFDCERIDAPAKIVDGSSFGVRDVEIKLFSRLEDKG